MDISNENVKIVDTIAKTKRRRSQFLVVRGVVLIFVTVFKRHGVFSNNLIWFTPSTDMFNLNI